MTPDQSTLIRTPYGFESFSSIQKVIKHGKIEIQLESGDNLICALGHKLLTNSGWKTSDNITDSDKILTKSGLSKVIHSEYTSGQFEFYDVVNTESHTYYTNNVVSHNCEFLGSTNTLIDAKKLHQLTWKEPINRHENLLIYEEPKLNHAYVMTVDVSRGVSIDYSAFIVVDVTDIPYRIVATYYDNEISPLLYPNIIYRAGMHFNNALVLIEVNDNGQQIADILHNDLEYDGVLLTQTQGRAGVRIGGTYKVKPLRGVRTTKQVKRIGCANLKSLIEGEKLLFSDYNLIFELFRFVENKASYEAEEGSHDDLVMCCVLFAWMATQPYFKNKTGTDVRDDLWIDNKALIEDSITPFGFFDVNSYNDKETVSHDEFYNMDFHLKDFDPDDQAPGQDNFFF